MEDTIDVVDAIDTKVLLLIKKKKKTVKVIKPKLFFYTWTYNGNKFL